MNENVFPKLDKEALPLPFYLLKEFEHKNLTNLTSYNTVSVKKYNTDTHPVESLYKPISKMFLALPTK